jgi:hypothetical protein
MGITDKFYEAMRVYLVLNDKVSRLSEAVKGLSDDVRDIDRRVVRLETFVEIAQAQKKLNPPD